MGNVCSWCLKSSEDDVQSNNHVDDNVRNHNPQHLFSSTINDQTPLLNKSGNHDTISSLQNNFRSHSNGEIVPSKTLPPPPVTNDVRTETNTSTETAESKMASIVEVMLSKLIDVSNNSSNLPQTNANRNELNAENDYLKQIIIKSLSSTKLPILPDVGLNNLPELLAKPVLSSETRYYVAQAASDLSTLLMNEIKIIHKESLVAVFE